MPCLNLPRDPRGFVPVRTIATLIPSADVPLITPATIIVWLMPAVVRSLRDSMLRSAPAPQTPYQGVGRLFPRMQHPAPLLLERPPTPRRFLHAPRQLFIAFRRLDQRL